MHFMEKSFVFQLNFPSVVIKDPVDNMAVVV